MNDTKQHGRLLNLAVTFALLIGKLAYAQQKPHVFVSAITHSGPHMASLDTQYRFDRTLERAVAKKYALVSLDTPPALLGKYMKSDGYYWIGGSWVYGCGQTCKGSFTYSAYAAHSKGNVEYPGHRSSPAMHRRHPSSVPKKRRPISTTSSVGRPRIDLVIPHAHRVSNFIRDSQTFIRKPPLHARIVLHDLIDVVAGFAEQRIATRQNGLV